MKKVSLVLTIVGLVVMGRLAIPHAVYADCKSVEIDCAFVDSGGEEKLFGRTTFSMCWSWSHAECRPCDGGAEWSYFAGWCNSTYQGCNNQCWGCYTDTNECFDQKGKKHYY